MSKRTILIPGNIHQRILARLTDIFTVIRISTADIALLNDQLVNEISGIASMGVIPNSLIARLPNLEIIAHFGVGYDVIDANYAARQGVIVSNTPDVLSEEVADTTVGLLLNTLRELPQAENYLRQGRWAKEGNYPLTKLTLRGRKIGIYGLGRIGLEIAKRLEAFGVCIEYHTRSKKVDVSYGYRSSLLELAQQNDTLIAIVPSNAATDHSVTSEVLSALGPQGVFINVGRGTVIDENVLIHALENGVIAGAGLDVFEVEPSTPTRLFDFPNVSLLPHVASASIHTRDLMADLVVDNLINWFDGKPALTPVIETINLQRSI
ncbi:2-hydroxyacid dehydrogenase [Lentilitoribacter sp. Alg239-R112]|uniref:2-hydroxyacid dehydrogenase n=1 Tax=Lentilitoribacter sp. Alg239-R112 TaxID=2305987 RepID=UPI0013A68CA6|nr:2-hydroxyacid dehydrogenase [Lentilitoribacter sp. Alg239-R112]